MKKALIMAISAFMAAGMLTACGNNSGAEVSVAVENCQVRNIFDSVTANGTVEQDTGTYIVSTEIESYCVKNVFVKVGDSVKKGDKICEFDTDNIKQQITDIQKKISDSNSLDEQTVNNKKTELSYLKNSQKVKLDNLKKSITLAEEKYDDVSKKYEEALKNCEDAKKQYESAKAELDNAHTEEEIASCSSKCELYQTQLSMYTQECDTYYSLVSEYKEALNSCKSNYDSTEMETNREIDKLQYEIDSYKSDNSEYTKNLDNLNNVLKNSVIYAPSDGVVTSLNVEKGKSDTEKNLATIVNDASKVIHISISDRDVLAVKEGMAVDFYLLSDSSNILKGTVSKINYVKAEKGFDVFITSDDIQDKNIGMLVSCSIITLNEEVNSIRKDAVWRNADNSADYVFVAEPNADGLYVLSEKKVETGIKNNEYIQIMNDEIDNDSMIVVSDTSALTDGMIVEIIDMAIDDVQ